MVTHSIHTSAGFNDLISWPLSISSLLALAQSFSVIDYSKFKVHFMSFSMQICMQIHSCFLSLFRDIKQSIVHAVGQRLNPRPLGCPIISVFCSFNIYSSSNVLLYLFSFSSFSNNSVQTNTALINYVFLNVYSGSISICTHMEAVCFLSLWHAPALGTCK